MDATLLKQIQELNKTPLSLAARAEINHPLENELYMIQAVEAGLNCIVGLSMKTEFTQEQIDVLEETVNWGKFNPNLYKMATEGLAELEIPYPERDLIEQLKEKNQEWENKMVRFLEMVAENWSYNGLDLEPHYHFTN